MASLAHDMRLFIPPETSSQTHTLCIRCTRRCTTCSCADDICTSRAQSICTTMRHCCHSQQTRILATNSAGAPKAHAQVGATSLQHSTERRSIICAAAQHLLRHAQPATWSLRQRHCHATHTHNSQGSALERGSERPRGMTRARAQCARHDSQVVQQMATKLLYRMRCSVGTK